MGRIICSVILEKLSAILGITIPPTITFNRMRGKYQSGYGMLPLPPPPLAQYPKKYINTIRYYRSLY